jgi:hypothetical protein
MALENGAFFRDRASSIIPRELQFVETLERIPPLAVRLSGLTTSALSGRWAGDPQRRPLDDLQATLSQLEAAKRLIDAHRLLVDESFEALEDTLRTPLAMRHAPPPQRLSMMGKRSRGSSVARRPDVARKPNPLPSQEEAFAKARGKGKGGQRNELKGGKRGDFKGTKGVKKKSRNKSMPAELQGMANVNEISENLCYAFNLEGCTAAEPGAKCPRGWHQCARVGCLSGKHGHRQHDDMLAGLISRPCPCPGAAKSGGIGAPGSNRGGDSSYGRSRSLPF